MNDLLSHRGPDDDGTWIHPARHAGLGHRRLSIIDLETGQQPMADHLGTRDGAAGNWITYNGEIYNYLELRDLLGRDNFATTSDTEVILQAYRKWGAECVRHFRGMFAFAIWDEANRTLFCARDRFGIKPLYYAVLPEAVYVASEAKAILPFLDDVATDIEGFKDYLCFQFCLHGKTLFKGVQELQPGHVMTVKDGRVEVRRYWEIYYDLDLHHTDRYFEQEIERRLRDSVTFHLRSDVPVHAYLSGGVDSSLIAILASEQQRGGFAGYHGKFALGAAYDESPFARDVASRHGFELREVDIRPQDFLDCIEKIIYSLDYPVAGPGAFPQFVVSKLASESCKVVLGGQGGDEIFAGYTRYLIAYFEQCIKAAIDGTLNNGNFVVTYESIIPSLSALRSYKPLIQEFWRGGLFEDMDKRYFRLINRSRDLGKEVRFEALGAYSPYDTFLEIFRGQNVGKESYLDQMTHFDFKTLLPALLHVEDRMGMAHGLESRVPFLDHPLVELAATIPANYKFKDGRMKHILLRSVGKLLPESIRARPDKMGFPVPLTEWITGVPEVRDFITDTFSSQRALSRDLIDNRQVLACLNDEPQYGRKIWGFLCLELWQLAFHDRASELRKTLADSCASPRGL